LVIGSTGKTGRRVADRLRARGVAVRAGSRRSTPSFDWDDRGTWGPALAGVRAAYITYHPDLAVPGAAEAIAELCALAVGSGVDRLVLLSGRGEREAQRCERIVAASGAEWTVVRAAWFNQSFDEGHMLESVLSGVIALPAGDVAEPFVDVDDIADVAVAALTEDGHAGEIYEVTGPRLLTFAEVAAEISAASGRRVDYLPVSTDQWRKLMTVAGMPRDTIDMLAGLFTEILDGHNAYLTDGVQRALGRAPRDFSDYVRTAAATGAWRES
jgi:uncharacterized protein YbjT (DUF2867 family)